MNEEFCRVLRGPGRQLTREQADAGSTGRRWLDGVEGEILKIVRFFVNFYPASSGERETSSKALAGS
jgi:hypothetical protein